MSSIISPSTFTPLPITILLASLLEDANPTFISNSQIFIFSLFSSLNTGIFSGIPPFATWRYLSSATAILSSP